MLKLKLQYFGHLMWRADSLEKTLMRGKIGDKRMELGAEDEIIRYHHQLNGHEFEQTLGDSEGKGSLVCCGPWSLRVGDDLATEQQWKQQHGCIDTYRDDRFFCLLLWLLWTQKGLTHSLHFSAFCISTVSCHCFFYMLLLIFSSVSLVQLLSHVQLFVTPWTAGCQASLSITNSQSLLKLMSIESVIPLQPSHPLSSPSPPAFNLSQYQVLFKGVSSSHQVAKVLEFQLHHQSFQWIFRTDLL